MDYLSSDHLTGYLPTGIAAILLALYGVRLLANYISSGGLGGSKKSRKERYPPIVGTVLHQLFNSKRLHHYYTDLSRKHKTFRLLSVSSCNHIFTVDPPNVEHILKTNFNNYGKGRYNYENLKQLLGDGIFAVDGERWRHQRKLASHEFSAKALKGYSAGVFKSNAAKLAQIIYAKAKSNQTMDIQDLFMKSAMDSIFEVGFGMELNCLQGFSEGSRFARAFDNANELTMRRYLNPLWKVGRLLNFGSEAELKKNIKVVDDSVYKLISTKMEPASNHRNDSVKKEDILSRFLMEMEKDPVNMTRKYLRDIVLSFLIAGKDTTAGTLSWFIYMLCKHQQVQEKIAREVKESTEDDEDTDIDGYIKFINDKALDKMQYLQAALSETLRLYPPVPLDSKVCFSDDTLPDGFSVRKGDIVFYQPYSMGRMEFIWGDDAEVFRPERWIDNNGFFRPESPFKFTAFQAGPRICLGKEFAYRQMMIFAAVLLRFFKFKLADETKVVNYRVTLTLHINQGLHILAFHRKLRCICPT